MTFEQIPIRMLQLGVDRVWLAKQCNYSTGSLAAILAPKGNAKAKTDKALRRIWEVLDREEELRKRPSSTTEKCAIIVRPSADELTEWNKASMKQCLTIEQWAIQQLNDAAHQGAWPKGMEDSVAAEEPTLYRKK